MTSLSFRFQQALDSPGYSLSQFYRTTTEDIFPEAGYHPDVLKCYAVNGGRFIKQFLSNPHSNLRIFYFQLIRLCYMPNLVHTLPFLNRLKKIILNRDFEIIFCFDTEQKSFFFNNNQFKKLFAQFIDYLDYQEQPCVENAINDYPIMDIVMIHIMRSLLVTRNINPDFNSRIQTKIVFKQLCDLFKLKLSTFKDYWVFEDSNFIVHAESEFEIYTSYKESTQNQDIIRKRKKINVPLSSKPSEDAQTALSINCEEQVIKDKTQRHRFLSPSQSINNIMSPKQKTFNRVLPHLSFHFTSNNILNSKNQLINQQPSKSQLKIAVQNSKLNDSKTRKYNQQPNNYRRCEPIKLQLEVKDYYKSGLIKKSINTESAYFKGMNKQNLTNLNRNNNHYNPFSRNISLENNRNVSRSKSFCRGIEINNTKFFRAK